MVEARTMEGLVQGVEITPLLRVIHRRVLAEAGVSTTGSVRLNLTYTTDHLHLLTSEVP
jgi:hypothetical protein